MNLISGREWVRCVHRLSMLIGLLAAAIGQSAGQTVSPNGSADEMRGTWVTVGAGVGETPGDFGPALSIALYSERTHQVLSARWDKGAPGLSDDVDAVGVLLGRSSAKGRRYAQASVGISAMRFAECISSCGLLSSGPSRQKVRNGVGLTFAGDAALRFGASRGVGLGLAAFAHLNTATSFAGIALEISAGKWR